VSQRAGIAVDVVKLIKNAAQSILFFEANDTTERDAAPAFRIHARDHMMKKYSVFAVAREAMRHHTGWTRAWRDAQPKKKYDVIIIGAGGHGLATAYYLGKNFGITNVAILEKGWLGGGNTGRNTTIIRSNYLQDPSAAIYEKSRSLYETMSQPNSSGQSASNSWSRS